MPGYQCPKCKEWVQPDPTRPSALHICSGRPVPTLKKLRDYVQSTYPPKQEVMANDQKAGHISHDERRLFDFALMNFLAYAPSSKAERDQMLQRALGDTHVETFAKVGKPQRLALIDKLWDAILEWTQPDKLAKEMFEPDAGDPVHNASSTTTPKAFQKFGIGFRCEKKDDLQRILDHGFEPLYNLPDIAEKLGHRVRGTSIQTKTAQRQLGLWRVNKDAIGQTGICVSRGAKGATKFPEADYKGTICLFAVKPSGRGFDTEAWQAKKGAEAVWKPGEKLFPFVSRADVIAYVLVDKVEILEYGLGWKIRVRDDKWTYLGGSAEERRYLDQELAALAPDTQTAVTVSAKDYDFHQS